MALEGFDHVNVKTNRLEEMVDWYDRILGMKAGPRPDFDVPGAWMYLGDTAVVHLVGVDEEPQSLDPKIEHFAFRAKGFAEFLDHLRANDIDPRLSPVPGTNITQVNISDPDGNHIHIDFTSEA